MAKTDYTTLLAMKSGVKLGATGAALNRNDPAFTDWLVDQVPEGGTISEVLVAIALDTWNEQL